MSSYGLIPTKRLFNLFRKPTGFAPFFSDLENELGNFGNLMEEESPITLKETKKEIIIQAPLPGLNPKEIEITLERGILQIKGEQEETEEDKDAKYYRKAKRSYWYQLALPGQIEESQEPKTSYKNGILELTFQKAKQSIAKKITLKAGG